ncbi:hypothetical protein Tco_0026680 [Tanacetum coccineum]
MALELMSKAFQLNNITPTNNNQRSSSNPCYSQISQSGMNIDQDKQMLMVDDNNVGNQNGFSIVPRIANQHRNGNVVAALAEGNSNEINGNQIRCYNYRGEGHYASNCTVKPRKRGAAYLQTQLQIAQKDEVGIQLNYEEFDFLAATDGSAEIKALHLSSAKQITTLNEEIENLNNQLSKEKSTVSFLQEERKRLKNDFKTREDKLSDKQIQLENKIKKLDNILVKTGQSIQTMHMLSPKPDSFYHTEQKMALGYQNPFYLKQAQQKQQKADESLAKHKALELEIEHLLRAVVSQEIMSIVQNPSVVDSSNLQTKLERIFRNNPFKAYRLDNFMPNKHVKESIRTKPITISKTNGFSPKDVKSTTRTRRPLPRNNHKSHKVPFKSKSSCLSNKLEKLEENHRSLQSSNYLDHTSSECNIIKLAIRNEKYLVIFATCKQCLIIANHDECLLQYVNGMKSTKKKQSANVSNVENQKKHKPKVRKPKKVRSKERLASPKPSTPRSYRRWSPTGRIFDLNGKIITTSEPVCESDCSKGDNACTSNPQEPINKRFPSSTFSMTSC